MHFSVVIPLYNKKNHIKRAVDSVLNQRHQKFEVIVVDDGSTDQGAEVVKQIKDPRIRLFTQLNAGVSNARNHGISESQYEYIGFLDADDEWKPNFLEEIIRLMKKSPSAGAYATGYAIKRTDGLTISGQWKLPLRKGWEGYVEYYFRYARRKPLISASSVVIPKAVFASVGGFAEGIARGEDLEMWCRIALNYQIVFYNRICVTYYQDAENRACYRPAKLENSFANIAESILENNRESRARGFEEYMLNIMIGKATYLLRDGKIEQAREVLSKCRHTKANRYILWKTYSSIYYQEFMRWKQKKLEL